MCAIGEKVISGISTIKHLNYFNRNFKKTHFLRLRYEPNTIIGTIKK